MINVTFDNQFWLIIQDYVYFIIKLFCVNNVMSLYLTQASIGPIILCILKAILSGRMSSHFLCCFYAVILCVKINIVQELQHVYNCVYFIQYKMCYLNVCIVNT